MKNEKIKSINYQLIATVLFMISLVISIFLALEDKRELLNEDRVFSETFDKYLNLFNRIFALLIIIFILYINYRDYLFGKINRSYMDPLRHQLYASIFSVIAAIIVLYVVIENWYESPNISVIENPII